MMTKMIRVVAFAVASLSLSAVALADPPAAKTESKGLPTGKRMHKPMVAAQDQPAKATAPAKPSAPPVKKPPAAPKK